MINFSKQLDIISVRTDFYFKSKNRMISILSQSFIESRGLYSMEKRNNIILTNGLSFVFAIGMIVLILLDGTAPLYAKMLYPLWSFFCPQSYVFLYYKVKDKLNKMNFHRDTWLV